jgi:hypothetical protein
MVGGVMACDMAAEPDVHVSLADIRRDSLDAAAARAKACWGRCPADSDCRHCRR